MDVLDSSGLNFNLQALAKALGGEVRNGQVRAPGPGHSPQDRSLVVRLDAAAPDGFVVHSFADDDPIQCKDYVREKAGLPGWKPNGNGRKQRHVTDGDIDKAVMSAIMAQTSNKSSPVVVRFDYTDEKGVLLYQVQKHEPKSFSQRRPDGNGGWIYNLDGVRRVLYRLVELLKFPDATVFVTEGEKDAARVAGLGHCATTVASGRWDGVDLDALRGRDILVFEDNDKAGCKRALVAAQALHGVAKTIRIVRLPGLPDKGDVSDWLDADAGNADKLVDVCCDTALWTTDTAKAEAEAETADNEAPHTEAPHTEGNDLPPLPFLRVVEWQHAPVPERAWVVRDRIPLSNVTLLSGEGAVGKSILSLHLAAATVLARDWAGSLPEPGAALVVACEDDADELHRRLDAIVRHYGVSFADLAGNLHITSLAGQDALLATPRRDGLLAPTKLFARVQEAACDIKPTLIVLDNSADVFGGNENDRAQVRQFIGILRGLAIAANTGVLLTSHPSLTGISSGTGLSGSTAWNASVRSRLYFKRATTSKDEEPDPDLRILEVMKSNYGPVGETVTMRWKDGLFLPVAAPGSLEKLARERKADELFLMLLDRWTSQGRKVSDKRTANTYAPTRFADEPEAKNDKVSKRELAEAMERLFRVGTIRVANYGLPSKGWTRVERK